MKTLFSLTKPGISLTASLSAATGFLLATGELTAALGYALIGTWFAASGSAALNQVQESSLDALMTRTRKRPIPTGAISRGNALLVSVALILVGVTVLAFGAGYLCAALCGFAVFWYNGVYTYLKRLTPYAVVPGALIGMIPPAIGWIAGGGEPLAREIFAVGVFFLIWQIPHFWLLQLMYAEDIGLNGLPSVFKAMTERQLKRITFIWIFGLVAIGLLFPLFGLLGHSLTFTLFIMSAVLLILYSTRLLVETSSKSIFRGAFSAINLFIFLTQMILILDREMQRIVS